MPQPPLLSHSPRSVSRYYTFGGNTGKTVRVTSPLRRAQYLLEHILANLSADLR